MTTLPCSWALSIFSNVSVSLDIGSRTKCVFTTPLAAMSMVSIASFLLPTALPTILLSFRTRWPGKAPAIGAGSPSGIPTQTRVPENLSVSKDAAYAALLAVLGVGQLKLHPTEYTCLPNDCSRCTESAWRRCLHICNKLVLSFLVSAVFGDVEEVLRAERLDKIALFARVNRLKLRQL